MRPGTGTATVITTPADQTGPPAGPLRVASCLATLPGQTTAEPRPAAIANLRRQMNTPRRRAGPTAGDQASTGRAERSRRGLAAARQTATGPAWPAESAAADRSTVTALPDGSPMGSAAACQMMFHTPGSSRRRQTLGREAATAAGPEGRAARPPGTRTRPDAALETDTVTPISATRALWVSRLVIADPASLRVPTPGTQARADEAGRPATRDPTTPATPTPDTPTPATPTPATPTRATPIPGTQARADEAGRPTTRDPTTPATPTPDTPTPATPTPATPTRATPTPGTQARADEKGRPAT